MSITCKLKIDSTREYDEHVEPFLTLANFSCNQSPGRILGIIGQDPSVPESKRLHVDIFWFFFVTFEAYSIDSH